MDMSVKSISTFLTILALACTCFTASAANKIANSAEIKKLINELSSKHKFDKYELNKLFNQVEYQPKVIERMTRPAEGLPWHRYRNIFLKETRIKQGVEFWAENAETLMRAEQEYGVPAEIIVAIIGVETRFGRVKGGYRVMDALSTLVADYPRRARFFRKELVEFMLFTRKEGMDPMEFEGSYAGAIGKPQFMPSSYRMYAVDFDGDNKRDLLHSNADAIGSVANYLRRHGWQRNEPITAPAKVQGNGYGKVLKKGLKPRLTLREANSHGVVSHVDFEPHQKVSLIELETTDGMEYWVGLKNFYAITRYNHSALYAMAVYQLAEEIRNRRARLASAN
jgi:membrane-bound lytic murein transglycosylase B